MSPIGALEGHQIYAVSRPQARGVVEDRDEFGIKAYVYATGVIVELEIRQQRDVGKHILDEKRLAPAAVPHNQVGPEAPLEQTAADFRDPCAGMNRTIELHSVGMAIDVSTLILGVHDFVDPRHRIVIGLGNEIDLVANLA